MQRENADRETPFPIRYGFCTIGFCSVFSFSRLNGFVTLLGSIEPIADECPFSQQRP